MQCRLIMVYHHGMMCSQTWHKARRHALIALPDMTRVHEDSVVRESSLVKRGSGAGQASIEVNPSKFGHTLRGARAADGRHVQLSLLSLWRSLNRWWVGHSSDCMPPATPAAGLPALADRRTASMRSSFATLRGLEPGCMHCSPRQWLRKGTQRVLSNNGHAFRRCCSLLFVATSR